jgi:hypothetical protein
MSARVKTEKGKFIVPLSEVSNNSSDEQAKKKQIPKK